MNIIRIIGASLSGVFVFDAFCNKDFSLSKLQDCITGRSNESLADLSRLRVPPSNYEKSNGVFSSNACPVYSNNPSPICKYLARKNAVGSNKGFYKKEEISVKFDNENVKKLLQKSADSYYAGEKITKDVAQKLIGETIESINGFLKKGIFDSQTETGNILVDDFSENRIRIGSNSWISSEESDEFVSKRIFSPRPCRRVSFILDEWERKFRSTIDEGTVKSVVERIKNVDVLSGLLAAAVCDEYEKKLNQELKGGDTPEINRSFIETVYKQLNKDFFNGEGDKGIPGWSKRVKKGFGNQEENVDERKFCKRDRFDAVTMTGFFGNFKSAFLEKKESIIKNTLDGLDLYKVERTLKNRFNSVKDVIGIIDENNGIFSGSFGGFVKFKVNDNEKRLNLDNINVDLSFMEAIGFVHACYEQLLRGNREIKIFDLYSCELIEKLRGDQNNPELLYASVLASKIMETFLYQACYAQEACNLGVISFLKAVTKSLAVCDNGLKVSAANYINENGLEEVFYTEEDKGIFNAAGEYQKELKNELDKKISNEEGLPKILNFSPLDSYLEIVSEEMLEKVLKKENGQDVLIENTEIYSIFGNKVADYNEVFGLIYCDIFALDNKLPYNLQAFLKLKDGSFCKGRYYDSIRVFNSKACYDDCAILKAFKYAMEGKPNKISDEFVEIEEGRFLLNGEVVGEKNGSEVQINGNELEDWQSFLIIREELKKAFAGIKYYDTRKNVVEKYMPGGEKGENDDFWNKLTACVVAGYFIKADYADEKSYNNNLLAFYVNRQTMLGQNKEVAIGSGTVVPLRNGVNDKITQYNSDIHHYNETMYSEEALKGDNGGFDYNRVMDALDAYNSAGKGYKPVVEDIYLSANLAWFWNQCGNINEIISSIKGGKFDNAGKLIIGLYNDWTNLKWLSAHQSGKVNGMAGVGLSEFQSRGIGFYIDRCLDVPVFSSTKEWFSQTGKLLPEKLEDDNKDVVVDVLSRMHKDICSFFVSRIAATFLCNIFEGNKDYSSFTEKNESKESLVLKSFSSSIVDLIADVYKIKESIDKSGNSSKNIANSSDLLVYAKDCLLDSTTCNKGVVTKLEPELTYVTRNVFSLSEKEVYCFVPGNPTEKIVVKDGKTKTEKGYKGIPKPISPMTDIDHINLYLQDSCFCEGASWGKHKDDSVLDEGSGRPKVFNFSDRDESAMHPLSFVALVDFIGGRMNFDQRMVLLDSISIPIEGLFEEFQRVTKSGLLGESQKEFGANTGGTLEPEGLGSVTNRLFENNDRCASDRYVYGITENPFFVPEGDRDKYGCASGNICTASTPLLYSLRNDSFGKTTAFSLNEVVKKKIFPPKKIQVLLQMLVKSKDLEYIHQSNKPVFYYLSFRERDLAYGVESVYNAKGRIPLTSSPTRNGIYLYKSPYFSPVFSISPKLSNASNKVYSCWNLYSPFYLNVGDVYSRAVLDGNSLGSASGGGLDTISQLGCFRNILGNIDFYNVQNKQQSKITGDSVKRLADRFFKGLFNLKLKNDLFYSSDLLDNVILNEVPDKSNGCGEFDLNEFVVNDLKRFSDLLLLSGTVNITHVGGLGSSSSTRINNSSVCMMHGIYAPYFCSDGYMADGKNEVELNNLSLYKGFLLPAARMLLSDEMGSFVLENKFLNEEKGSEWTESYVKSMFDRVVGSDDFAQYFHYGEWKWLPEDYISKMLSGDWDVRYTNSVEEKRDAILDLSPGKERKGPVKDSIFLFLLDNEPKHIYKIAEQMYGDYKSSYNCIAISETKNKNDEVTVEYIPGNVNSDMLGDSTKRGFFYISSSIDQYIKNMVSSILKSRYFPKNNEVKKDQVNLYAGLLSSLLFGADKFKLNELLKK